MRLGLNLGLNSGGRGFTPASLFANGEQGAWYDIFDLSTLYQDSAGTTAVTGPGDPVGRMLDKSGNGNHAIQSTDAARPVLRQDAGGRYYLEFDGADDSLEASYTATVPTALIAAMRWSSGIFIVVHQVNGQSDDYTNLQNGDEASQRAASTGTASAGNIPSGDYNLTGRFVSNIERTVRIDGVDKATDTTSVAAKTYDTLGIGGRVAGGSLAGFSGRLYGLVAFGAAISDTQLQDTESYLANKAGVTL